MFQLHKVLDGDASIPETLVVYFNISRCLMIPAGGGRRILAILELLMKDHTLDFFRQEPYLSKIRGNAASA